VLTYEVLVPGGSFINIQTFNYPILTHIDDSLNLKTFVSMNKGTSAGSGMICIGEDYGS
jgi:hypothetical protein